MEKEDQIIDKLNQIQIDIKFIKENLVDDGELSGWAKQELAKARKESEENYVSLDNL